MSERLSLEEKIKDQIIEFFTMIVHDLFMTKGIFDHVSHKLAVLNLIILLT